MSNISESNGKNFVWPSAETIGKELHVNARTAKRRLYELEKQRYIRIERRSGQTSKIFLITTDKNVTTTRDKNVTTTSDRNDTTTRDKNVTQNIKNEIDTLSYKKPQKKKTIFGNHIPNYDSEAFAKKAENPVYIKQEEPQEEIPIDYLPF